jgi:hypothetical protein
MTKWPVGEDFPPSQEAFAPLTASIRLYLANNLLRSLPTEMFNIERLTVLSLRHNKLGYLPPAISKLTNLTELNLAGNRLEYLPWEILKLVKGKLKRLYAYPNPFIEVDIPFPEPKSDDEVKQMAEGFFPRGFELMEPASCTSFDGTEHTFPRRWKPICLGNGSITYLTTTGQPSRNSDGLLTPSCTSTDLARPDGRTQTQPPNLFLATRAPSLTELALQRCSSTPYLDHLSTYLPADTSPDVIQLLETAKRVKSQGGKICSACGRKYVVARTEWIEWWDCIPPSDPERPSMMNRNIPPLLREGCSWRCVPGEEG